MTADLHVVLGATGGVGAALVDELARRGHPTRAVSRRGTSQTPGVDTCAADVTDPDQLADAVAGAAVVHHAAQPPYTRWPEEFPAMTEHIVEATAHAGAHLVVVDNLYMYGPVPGGYGPGTPHGPLHEDTAMTAQGRKGGVRAAMARTLAAHHAAGDLPITVGRLADYHGPGGMSSSVGAQLFRNALAGSPAMWLGPSDHPHSFSFLPDAARALVTLADQPGLAAGRVWHLPVAPPITPRQFIALVHQAAGVRHRIRTVPAPLVRAAGAMVPIARELAELSYQVERPFVVDDSRYRATFGDVDPTPHGVAVTRTLRWFTEQGAAPGQTSALRAL